MTESRCEQLTQAHLDGLLSADETRELSELLIKDQSAADVFARATRFEALLQMHLAEEKQINDWSDAIESAPEVRPQPPRFRWRAMMAAATAAALLIAVGFLSLQPSMPSLKHRVVAGRMLVDGVEARTFADNSQLEVLGSATAAIELANGSNVELTPATTATVQRDGDEAVFKLVYGNAKFRTGQALHPLRVDTQLGAVSARAADFAVDSNLPTYFVVAVDAGQVEVQEADKKVKVSAGESRAFANEKVPIFAGKVVDVAAGGDRLTLEGNPSKPGAPPQRRELAITKETQLKFHGARVGEDRPAVGLAALATLDKTAPSTAIAIEFGDKTPTVAGAVKEISEDGRTLKIEIYRKGDTPLMRTIALDERTRTSYSGTVGMERKPTAGYFAYVWLVGDTDRAAEIRFVFKSKKPAEKDADPGASNPQAKKPMKPESPAENNQQPTSKPKPEPASMPEPQPKLPAQPEKPIDPANSQKPDGKKVLPGGKKMAVRATNRDPHLLTAEIDGEIARRLSEANIAPSPAADDAEFLRRATLDITGCIPSYAAARTFLEDQDPNKRRKLIDNLLADQAYGRRFGGEWKRLIQPKPDSLGKPGVDRITPWLAEQFNANRGWNDIVHELLTTEANLAREPQAYFLAVNSESFDPKPNLLTASTAKLFLGVQLACAECHDHPFAEWKQTEFWGLAAFFSRVQKKSKSDFTLREEASDAATPAEIKIPEGGKSAGEVVPARFLGGDVPDLNAVTPLRKVLADWVTSGENPYFARTMVNRTWAHFFGRGLVEPLDGFQPDFAASHPVVLDLLTAEFVASDFDLQHIVRIICNTQAYGRTSRPLLQNGKDNESLSRMRVKMLSPDMLYQSLTAAINADLQPIAVGKNTKRPRPELVSIGPRDEFISFFAGPAAESGVNEYSHGIPQLLRLMNAEKLNVGLPLARSLAESTAAPKEKIDSLYLAVLARRPTTAEQSALADFITAHESNEQAYAGAVWILLNSSEFLLNR